MPRRFIFFQNPSGDIYRIDNFANRLQKMRASILLFSEMTKQMYPYGSYKRLMVTLTYRPQESYKADDIRRYLKSVKRLLLSKVKAYAWVAELQKRREIHYHVFFVLELDTLLPKPDESGMWTHGLSQVAVAQSPYYLLKHLGKQYQKDLSKFPRSCRLYSISFRVLNYRKQFRDILSSNIKPKGVYNIYIGTQDPLQYLKTDFESKGGDNNGDYY